MGGHSHLLTLITKAIDTTATVDLVIFMCLDFREFVILELFMKSRTYKVSILMTGSAHNNNFREILQFVKIKTL